ncbi:MAG: thiamine-phosphate kinase [bacterium]
MRLITDIGEEGIIQKLFKKFSYPHSKSIIVPNGDDAFVSLWHADNMLVATADMLIEDVHFTAHPSRWVDIGYKAMAVNISDLAAMGDVKPLYALVSIGINPATPIKVVDKIITGLWISANKVGIKIVGGDTVKSIKHMVISINLIGEANKKNIVKRSGAQIGDKLLISGELGLSHAGLKLLKENRYKDVHKNLLINSHLRPPLRLSLAQYLGRHHAASSMIDSSDGLDVSLRQLRAASHTGFDVYLENLPLHSALRSFCRTHKTSPYECMVFGGEDYELICTIPQNKLHILKSAPQKMFVIGEVTRHASKIRYMLHTKIVHIESKSFAHF